MGELYTKIAAATFSQGLRSDPTTGALAPYETPGFLERGQEIFGPRADERAQQNAGASSWQQQLGVSPGMPPEYYRGQGSPFSFAMQGLSAFSPELAMLGSFAPMLLPQSVLQSEAWQKFNKRQTMYYAGGNPQRIDQVQAAMSRLQQLAAKDIDNSLKDHISSMIGSLPDSLTMTLLEKGIESDPKGVSAKLREYAAKNPQAKGVGQVLAQLMTSEAALSTPAGRKAVAQHIQKLMKTDPTVARAVTGSLPNLGTMLQAVYPMLPPEAQNAMQLLLPRVAISMQPIANAVSMVMGGDPTPEKLDQFATSFTNWYDQQTKDGGALNHGGAVIPKMQAMEVFGFATRFAPNLTKQGLTTLTNQAVRLQQEFGLPSLGNSLVILQQMGAEKYANDPKQFNLYISKKLSDLKASGGSPKDMSAAAEMALKSGQNIHTIMDAQSNSARVSQALAKLPGGQRMANLWATAAQRLTSSNTGALFAAALASPRLGNMARKARETGDPVLMQKVLTAARSNTATMQMAGRLGKDDIASALTGNATSALMSAGAVMRAKRMGVSPRDMALMRDPKFVQDMMEGNSSARSRLSVAAQRFMKQTGNSGVVALMATELTSKPFVVQHPKFIDKPTPPAIPSQAAIQQADAVAATAPAPAPASEPPAPAAEPAPAAAPAGTVVDDAKKESAPVVPVTPAKPPTDSGQRVMAIGGEVVDSAKKGLGELWSAAKGGVSDAWDAAHKLPNKPK